MGKRTWVVITAVVAMLASVSSQALECIAVISGSGGTHYWRAVEAGAKKAASELGLEVFFRQPLDETAHQAQRQLIDEALQRGCRGLVLAPSSNNDADALAAWHQRGIPVVLIDRPLNVGPVAGRVMTDNYAAGRLAAQKLMLALRDRGHVTVMRLKQGIASTDAREQGFLDEIRHSHMTLVEPVYLGTDIAEIRQNAEQYLQRHAAELDGIFTPNEMTTVGVMAELRRSPRHGAIVHIGFDYNRFLLKALQQGEISGLILQQPYAMGYQGVKMAASSTAGADKDVIHFTPVFYLTAKSMNEPQGRQFLQLNTEAASRHKVTPVDAAAGSGSETKK